MKQYNIIIVFSKDKSKVLMCKRKREPYIGMLNFIGGKIEPNETHEAAAYRELWEETSISNKNITLIHLMDFSYIVSNILVEVYYGILLDDIDVKGEENKLVWIDSYEDFSNSKRFAGEGNIYHMMEYIRKYCIYGELK